MDMVRRIIFMVLCNERRAGACPPLCLWVREGQIFALRADTRAYKARLPDRVREGQALALRDCGDVETGRSLLRSRGIGPRTTEPVGAVSNRAYRRVRAYKARLPDRVREGQALALRDCGDVETGGSPTFARDRPSHYGTVGMLRPGGLSYVREGQALALRSR